MIRLRLRKRRKTSSRKLAKEAGIELTDDELEDVAGGAARNLSLAFWPVLS